MDFALLRDVAERELGKPLERAFARFDEQPLASASIGQVHRAQLPSGEEVVVKIQYPGVAEAIRGDLANVGADSQYTLELDPPGRAGIVPAASGTLVSWNAAVVSIWWELQVDLDTLGRWDLKLRIDGRDYTFPFDVVGITTPFTNRAPNPVSASLEPVGLRVGQVPVCRVLRDAIADPDYDVVSYRYDWRVDGQLVRSITSAAMSDALARQFAIANRPLSCTVTVSDGKSATEPVVANAMPEGLSRRRAVR